MTKLMIGVIISIVMLLTILLFIKEPFMPSKNGLISSSGVSSTSPTILSYLTTDADGNMSVEQSGHFKNVDVNGNLTLFGYPGNVGDVMVSNGVGYPPVWAQGVGMSDFTGSQQSIGKTSGYQRLPGGLIIQWGNIGKGWHSGDPQNFPIAFPNNCMSVTVTSQYDSQYVHGSSADPTINNLIMAANVTQSSFTVVSTTSQPFYWMAVGN